MLMHLGALPPPLVSQLGAKDLLVRGWGVFSLQGHIPLNCLPNFSSLHHFSCSAFFLSFPFDSLVPLLLLLVFDLLPSLRPLFNLHRLFPLSPQQNFSLSHPYQFYSLFPFHSSSSLSDPPPLQPCIIRPKHKPAQAHIWKEFGHGSFLPRRLNI